MSKWKLSSQTLAGVFLGALSVALLGGLTVAGAAPSPHGPVQPANPHTTVVPHAAVDTAVESRFTPITPCRIVDTRLAGGQLHNGAPRSFVSTGTAGFTPQGGLSGGCGVPRAATALQANVFAVSAGGHGILRVWPYGGAVPNATFLGFDAPGGGTGGSIAITGAGLRQFTATVLGAPTHLVVDVTGYYVAPMWAQVNDNASLIRGSRVTGITHVATGEYQVDFDRSVSGCSYAVTAYYTGRTVGVEPRSGDANGVFVYFVGSSATLVDTPFYLTLTC